MLLFFFSLGLFLQHRSGCARQSGENLSRRSEGGGYSCCNCSVFFNVFGALFFFLELFFIFILQHRSTAVVLVQLATGSDILYERELYKRFVPSQLTRAHDVLLSPSTSPGRSWLGCSPKLLLYLFLQQTLVGSTGSNHTCRRKESLPMPLELHSTAVVSIHFELD